MEAKEERLELSLYDILNELGEVQRLLGSDLRTLQLRLAKALRLIADDDWSSVAEKALAEADDIVRAVKEGKG